MCTGAISVENVINIIAIPHSVFVCACKNMLIVNGLTKTKAAARAKVSARAGGMQSILLPRELDRNLC